MAYRADIEIAVKGAQELKRLQNEINATSKLVDGLNNYLTNIGTGGITRSINNLRNAVNSAAEAFNKAALGTDEATIAATKYVQATDKLNAGLRERSALLDKITRQERAAAMVRVGIGMPAQQLLLPAARQGAPAMGGGARRRITGPVERLGGARTVDEAAMALRFAQGLKEQVRPLNQIEALYAGIAGEALKLQGIKALPDTQMLNASVRGIKQLETAEDMRNRELQETAQRLENIDRLEASRQRRAAKLQGIKNYYAAPALGDMANAGVGVQGPAVPPAGITKKGPGLGANLLKRLPGAVSGGVIGGVFPLLFGQGGGAAAGGLIGGLAGGLLGPGGSFAGSLLGTLLGDIASQGQKIKQLGLDIGFSAQQASVLADGFKKANTDIEKFTGVVQNIRGLGLELEDQAELIKLTTSLTEKYGGQFDKVGNAITSALESGRVSQSTLNQLTSQGINVQQALADKLGVSRDRLLEMAKKGEISVQDLINTLVDLGNKGVEATSKPASGFDLLTKATKDLGAALSALGGAIVKALKPALDWLSGALGGIIGLAAQAIQSIANMLSGGTTETAIANARARTRLAAEGGPSAGTRYLTPAQQKRFDELQKEELGKVTAEKAKPLQKIDVTGLGQAAPTGAGSDKAARDAARLAEQRQKQLEAAARLAVSTDTQVKKAAALTEQEKLIADLDEKRMERMVKYETLYKEALSNAEINYLITAQSNEITAETLEYEKALLDIALEQSKILNQTDPLATLQEEINLLHAKLQGKKEEYTRQQAINKLADQNVSLDDAINQVDAQITLNKLLNQQNALLQMQTELFDSLASNVASAFSSAITTAVQGTEDLGTALQNLGSQLLGTIGNMLIMYGIAQALGAAGGGVGNPQGILSFLAKGFGYAGAADGGYWPGGFQAFADGGMVTRPTMGLVGEGGEAEYIIPASKMRGAMNRYAAGARGSAVIPAGDGGDGGTATMVAAPGAIDVRYTVERINSVDYVTADQFQQGMRQAAQQGAAQGEQRTLRRLQMSTSTRKRLGM